MSMGYIYSVCSLIKAYSLCVYIRRMPLYRKNSGKAYLYVLRELRVLYRCLQYSGGYLYIYIYIYIYIISRLHVGWSCATAYSNMRHIVRRMCVYS